MLRLRNSLRRVDSVLTISTREKQMLTMAVGLIVCIAIIVGLLVAVVQAEIRTASLWRFAFYSFLTLFGLWVFRIVCPVILALALFASSFFDKTYAPLVLNKLEPDHMLFGYFVYIATVVTATRRLTRRHRIPA